MASMFENLSKESRALLGVLSFLASEDVSLQLLGVEGADNLPEDLKFCAEKSSFDQALKSLLSAQLITEKAQPQTLSCPSTVSSEFRAFLPLEERKTAFNNTSTLLYYAFPKQSDETNKNQLYQQWTQCKELLPHVFALKDHFIEENERDEAFTACFDFCELLQHCQRYLYEIHSHTQLTDLHSTNLRALQSIPADLNPARSLDLHASILSHRANILESTGAVRLAITLNLQAYGLRLQEAPPKTGLLAGFEQNLGYCYDTANEHATALLWFEKARARWVEQGKEWPPMTKMNMARCLVYLGRYKEADELLDGAIGEFKAAAEERVNWAMLAYACFAQGVLLHREKHSAAAEASFLEARTLWLKGDQTQQHPFHAGCLYKIGLTCLEQGKKEESISHLRASLDITSVYADTMPAEHARGLFKLSEALLSADAAEKDGKEAQELKEQAKIYLQKRAPQMTGSDGAEECDQFVPIFWR